jgi:long-chain acyl-CoA synthetase
VTDIADIFDRHGHRPFLLDGQGRGTLTYAGFALAALDLARALERAGVAPGTRVAALLPNGPELACLYFACLALGAVAVPVHAKHAGPDREYILEVSRARLVACGPDAAPLVPEAFRRRGAVFPMGPGEAGWSPPREAFAAVVRPGRPFAADPDAPFSLTFTSGTTGRPKGIFHSAATLLGNARAFNQALDVSPGDRFLHAMPMSYMAGLLNCLLCPFAAGASLAVCREFDARLAFSFWDTAIGLGVNCLWSAPAALAMILAMDRDSRGEAYARRRLRFVAACTASLPEPVRAAFQTRYGVPVLPSFGLSETLINTVDHPGSPCPPGATGYPLPGIALRLAAPGGGEPPPGGEGELLVRSPGLMLGYLDPATGRPEPAPRDGWFATGDMAVLLPGGALRVTDRVKDIIVRGGVNVSPKKVEDALLAHEAVLEAAVVGVPDRLRGEKVVAALRLRQGRDLPAIEAALREVAWERLEPMAWPEAMRQLDDFPRSSTGKVDKRALRALLEGTC